MSHRHSTPPVHLKTIDNTVVLESSIHRWGLFATSTIPKGTLLCILRGQILTQEEYNSFLYSIKLPEDCFIEKAYLDDGRIIAMPFRTSYSFINHSDTKEMLSTKQSGNSIEVYACIDIPKNSEITSVYDLKKHIDVLGGFTI